MQPIHPLDTRPAETRDHDYIENYESGRGGIAVLAVVVVLSLIVGAVTWLGGGATTEAPTELVPNEAPVDPGS